ncbi:hypothetical protein ACFX15_005446 [Malus domestica]
MLVLPAGLQWCTWTLTPRPLMVLKLLTMNSYLSSMVMSAEKMIQKGSFWMTAWRSVPGVGFAGLESEESVTGMEKGLVGGENPKWVLRAGFIGI